MKKIFIFLIIFMVFLFGTGCGNEGGNKSADDSSGEYTASDDVDKGGSKSDVVPDINVSLDIEKIIKSGSIKLYTEDYSDTVEKIRMYVNGIGGFIQSSNDSYYDEFDYSSGRSGYIVIRVPAKKFDASMEEIKSYGVATSSSTNSDNISQIYQDLASELASLKIQEERLLTYLSKADKVTDMLAIEKELNRVRTEINSRTTILRDYDKRVDYSTISINVIESKSATGTLESPFADIGQKISSGFASTINFMLNMLAGLIVIFFRLLPFLIIAGIVLLIVFIVRKYGIKRK